MASYLTKRLGDLAAGDRILVGHDRYLGRRGTSYGPDTRIVTIASRSPELIQGVDGQGLPFDIPLSHGECSDWRIKGQVRWTAPLPDGTPEQVKAYCDTLMAFGSKSILLHVEGVSDGRFQASLVFQSDDLDAGTPASVEPASDEEESWSGEVVGNAAYWSIPVDVIQAETGPLGAGGIGHATPVPGDLVMGTDWDCRVVDGAMAIRAGSLVTVGSFPTREAVGGFMPAVSRPTPSPGEITFAEPYAAIPGPANYLDVARQRFEAQVRTQPDEALVIWFDDPLGERKCHFLGTSGYVFLHEDSPEDYFHGSEEAAGLYVLTDARLRTYTSFEGEHDAEMEGDFVPAIEADLGRFGFDVGSLDAEITDVVEADPETTQGATLRYIALAAIPAPPAP